MPSSYTLVFGLLSIFTVGSYLLKESDSLANPLEGVKRIIGDQYQLLVNEVVENWPFYFFHICLWTLAAYSTYLFFDFLFTPYAVVKLLDDEEHTTSRKQRQKNSIHRQSGYGGLYDTVNKNKMLGGAPPPYPNGWFRIGWSDQLKKGDVRSVSFLGLELAMFRSNDEAGKVYVVNAFCPHLGANLGVGGTVNEDRIVCPFHGWQFSGDDGACKHVPYTDHAVPSVAVTKTYICEEKNGLILLWHHADDEPPSWFVEKIGGENHAMLKMHGKSIHEVRAHIAEIPENGPDWPHLNIVHTKLANPHDVLGLVSLQNVVRHHWDAAWTAGEGMDAHKGHIRIAHNLKVGSRSMLASKVEATQFGMGLVHLKFDTPCGNIYMIEAVTPIAPLLQRACHTVFADPSVPRVLAKYAIAALTGQFEKDVPIWNNKTYLRNPILVKEEASIKKFRRWWKQFYSESSGKWEEQDSVRSALLW